VTRLILPILFLHLLLRQAQAETLAPVPDVHPGDHWTYRQKDLLANEVMAEVQRRVIAMSDKEITLSEQVAGHPGRKTVYTDRNWNIVDNGDVKYTPALDTLRFPLMSGDSWSRQYEGQVLKSGVTATCLIKGKTVGTEQKSVIAGSFDTIKIQDEVECRAADPSDAVMVFRNTIWYAPTAKRTVLSESSTFASGRERSKTSVELIEFHLETDPGSDPTPK
jgi:hypothetical protein